MLKEKLKEILKNPQGKLICVDLDNTLTLDEYWGDGEPDPLPNLEMIKFVNNLVKQGGHIIIYTARPIKLFQDTFLWLLKNDVSYHGISMQRKSGADLYIDDKALNIEDIYE